MSDSAIPLSFRPPQIENPLDLYGKVASIGQMMQNRQIGVERLRAEQLENEQRQRQIAGDKMQADLMTQHAVRGPDGAVTGTDWDAVQQGLAGAGYAQHAMKVGVDQRARQIEDLHAHELKLKNATEQNGLLSNVTAPVMAELSPINTDPTQPPVPPDPGRVEAALQRSRQTLKDPELLKLLPATMKGQNDQLDPSAVAQITGIHTTAQGYDKALTQQQATTKWMQDVVKMRGDIAEGKVKTAAAQRDYASRILGNAPDPGSWTQARDDMAKQGFLPEVMNQFDLAYSEGGKRRAMLLGVPPGTQEARDLAAKRIALSGGHAGMIIRANDPTMSPEQHAAAVKDLEAFEKSQVRVATGNALGVQARFDQREADQARKEAANDAKLHSTLQENEQAQWGLRQRYGNAVAEALAADKDAKTAKDPKTLRDIPIADAKSHMEEARQKALLIQQQAEEIRKRRQWGEYGGGAQTVAPPEPTALARPVAGSGMKAGAAAPVTFPPPAAAPQVPASAPPPPAAQPGPGKTWKLGDKTYTEGQVLHTRDGKAVRVVDVSGGKIHTVPLEP